MSASTTSVFSAARSGQRVPISVECARIEFGPVQPYGAQPGRLHFDECRRAGRGSEADRHGGAEFVAGTGHVEIDVVREDGELGGALDGLGPREAAHSPILSHQWPGCGIACACDQ